MYNGKIYRYNPTNFISPELEEDQYHQIISNGDILAYDEQNESWIYHYNNSLYLIARFSVFREFELRPEIVLYTYRITNGEITNLEREYFGIYLTQEDYSQYSANDILVYSFPIEDVKSVMCIQMGVYQNVANKDGWLWSMQRLTEQK